VTAFWLCEPNSSWNSCDLAIASRDDCPHRQIEVRCRRFPSILEEFGVPYYMKVDIEEHDYLCAEGFSAGDTPRYVSCEQSRNTLDLLPRLVELGFMGFKCISQRNFLPLQQKPPRAQTLHETLLALHANQRPFARTVRAIGAERAITHSAEPDENQARMDVLPGSSGAFGKDTLGQWLSVDEFRRALGDFYGLRAAIARRNSASRRGSA
jgi:hypothetical protein